MQYFLKKLAKTLDKYVLIFVSLRHKTNTIKTKYYGNKCNRKSKTCVQKFNKIW